MIKGQRTIYTDKNSIEKEIEELGKIILRFLLENLFYYKFHVIAY